MRMAVAVMKTMKVTRRRKVSARNVRAVVGCRFRACVYHISSSTIHSIVHNTTTLYPGEADNDSRSAERELVHATVKLVRLLANLSMDANIGRVLGSKNANALEVRECALSMSRSF